jgi:hypothetical protein
VRDRGACMLTLGEIAARAGVCITTARNALRQAAREGLLMIEERRRDKQPNLANVVRMVSREWMTWVTRGKRAKSQSFVPKRGGCKKAGATDKAFFKSLHNDHIKRDHFTPPVSRKAPSGVLPET